MPNYDIILAKFLNISTKLFFLCINLLAEIFFVFILQAQEISLL